MDIGKVLTNGFCNGFFGSDSYDEKTIIAEGRDWIVVRNSKGRPQFSSFYTEHQKNEFIKQWM